MTDDEQKLADVHPDETFKAHNGKEIKSLKHMLEVFDSISPESFAHHVTTERNDFANWIRDSVKDPELADLLQKTTDFDETRQIVTDRIELLEKRVEIKRIKDDLDSLRDDPFPIESTPEPAKPKETVEAAAETKMPDPPKVEAAEEVMPAPPSSLAPPPSPVSGLHPFEHMKKSVALTIRDAALGFIVGLVVGLLISLA